MAFGHLRDRALTSAEHQARYRAEVQRINAKWEFEQFCRNQQARVAATLKRQTDRILRARWGNPNEDRGLFVVTRQGTSECSAPVKRMYLEQGS